MEENVKTMSQILQDENPEDSELGGRAGVRGFWGHTCRGDNEAEAGAAHYKQGHSRGLSQSWEKPHRQAEPWVEGRGLISGGHWPQVSKGGS